MSRGREGFGGHVLTVAAFAAAFLAWCGFILYQAGFLPNLGGDPYTITTPVGTASLLTPGARVTVAGAEVGNVSAVKRASELGPGAELTLEITDDRVTPLPRDSRVAIRTRSQVGENYVAIEVGSDTQTVASGDSLGLQQAEDLVEVDEVLSTLSGPTRDRTRVLLEDFGSALTGRGDELNRTLQYTDPAIEYASRLVDVLHDDKEQVADLVDQLGRVTAAVGERGTAIDTIADRGLATLRAVGDRDLALAETLRELPSTLDQVRLTTQTVGDVSDQAAPVVGNLAVVTRELAPAVADLEPAARAGRSVVANLASANPELDRLLRAATAATRPLPAALPEIETTFCQLNPALRFLLPYKNDLLQSAFHLGSGSNSYDATGHLVRLVPLLSENSVSGAPPEVIAAKQTLLQSGAFLPQKTTSYDPFMKPGEIGISAADSNFPVDAQQLTESGYKYPRVKADC